MLLTVGDRGKFSVSEGGEWTRCEKQGASMEGGDRFCGRQNLENIGTGKV